MERITYYSNGKARVIIGDTEYAGRISNKLASYEDAEEQGLLVRLPYKVGGTAYGYVDGCIHRVKITGYRVFDGFILAICHFQNFGTVEWECDPQALFLTREEAEAALKGEMEDV